MWSGIASLIGWILGLIFPKKSDPSSTQLADSNARAQDAATQEQAANASLNQASTVRTDADVTVMHDVTTNDAGPAANEALKRDFPTEFRD